MGFYPDEKILRVRLVYHMNYCTDWSSLTEEEEKNNYKEIFYDTLEDAIAAYKALEDKRFWTIETEHNTTSTLDPETMHIPTKGMWFQYYLDE